MSNFLVPFNILPFQEVCDRRMAGHARALQQAALSCRTLTNMFSPAAIDVDAPATQAGPPASSQAEPSLTAWANEATRREDLPFAALVSSADVAWWTEKGGAQASMGVHFLFFHPGKKVEAFSRFCLENALNFDSFALEKFSCLAESGFWQTPPEV